MALCWWFAPALYYCLMSAAAGPAANPSTLGGAGPTTQFNTTSSASSSSSPAPAMMRRMGTLNFSAPNGRQMNTAQAIREVRRAWQLPRSIQAMSDAALRAEIQRRVAQQTPRSSHRRPGPVVASSATPARAHAHAGAAVPSAGCGVVPPTSGVYTINVTDPILGNITRR
jgi:hypothetical protein